MQISLTAAGKLFHMDLRVSAATRAIITIHLFINLVVVFSVVRAETQAKKIGVKVSFIDAKRFSIFFLRRIVESFGKIFLLYSI